MASTPLSPTLSPTQAEGKGGASPKRGGEVKFWRYERWLLAIILVAYLFLSLAFSFGPIFEGPDEIEHYRFVSTLIQTGALPDARTQPRAEYHQAPLYYFLLTPIGLLVHGTDFSQIDGRLNPFYPNLIAIPGNDNKNLYLHSAAEQFPYTGSPTALAVHLMRLISIALGAGTLLACYAIFRLLWPERPDRRLLALGVAAFTPGFLYMSSTVNNDNLLFLLTTLTLFLLLRQHERGPSWRLAFWLGIVLGAALLTKINALFLVFPVGAAVLLTPRSWRYMSFTLGMIIVIAGWWFIRNWVVYGDPTAIHVLLDSWKGEAIRGGALALDIGIPRAIYAYQTYWARFGQGAVSVGPWIYVFFNTITVVAVLGILYNLIRRRFAGGPTARQMAIVITFGLAWIASIVYYSSTAWSGNQGRYALTGLAAWGVLIAWGLDVITPQRLRLRIAVSGAAILATVAAICVFGYFLPTYAVSTAPGPIERVLSLHYVENGTPVAELIGVSPVASKGRPGEIVHIILYWHALRAPNQQLRVYLHSQDSTVVARDSIPGTGNLLSTDWQAGQLWAENYVIQLPVSGESQAVYPLLAGLYDPTNNEPLQVVDDAGHTVMPIIGQVAVNGPPAANQSIAYKFGDIIGLAAPVVTRSGDQVKVCLNWYSLAATTVDYHVFVHVMAGDSAQSVAQTDTQPKSGRYPTSAWTPGEAIQDCITVDAPNLPRDGWHVGIGLYNFETGQRLAVHDAQGTSVHDDTVLAVGS